MWTLELFRVTDGLRLLELPTVPFKWNMSVRDSRMDGDPDNLSEETFSGMRFSLDALATVMDLTESGWQARLREMFTPTKHGVMALWNGTPIVGGPINPLVDISRKGVDISVDSYWDLLKRRFMTSEMAFSSDRQLSVSGYQLYSIAAHMLSVAMSKKSGALPIVLPSIGFGNHTRTWQGFNVANLGITKLMEELSNVINGPDLVLRPRINGQRFEWVLVHGTDRNPYIGQSWVHDWEELSDNAGELTATLSSAYIAHRVYGVGDGEDVGTFTTRVDSEVPPEWPLLELVVTDSNITKESPNGQQRLDDFASGFLNAFPVIGLQMDVRASGVNELGTFWPGEIARVTVNGNPGVEDGTYDLRILSMSGSDSDVVTMEFEPMVLEVV